ncbi:MAG: hypothetical protein II824_04785, partial [Bacteroidales bacterium]|nr:hypothetical protein [Bacteroidales bacterium]
DRRTPRMNTPYDDIIGLEHPTSKRHPRMARLERAAQFAPFAALKGYEEVIDQNRRKNEALNAL